jgi:hypothetical protein
VVGWWKGLVIELLQNKDLVELKFQSFCKNHNSIVISIHGSRLIFLKSPMCLLNSFRTKFSLILLPNGSKMRISKSGQISDEYDKSIFKNS